MTDSKAIVMPLTAGWAMRKLWKAAYLLLNGKAGEKEAPLETEQAKKEALEQMDQVRRHYESTRGYVKTIQSNADNPLKNIVHEYYNCDFNQHELGKFYQEIMDSANNGTTDNDKTNNRKNLEDTVRRLDARVVELERTMP